MIHDFGIVWGERSLLLSGLANTAILSALSAVAALVLAFGLAPALMSKHPAAAWATRRGFVDGMRCVPFLLFAYIVYYGFPTFGLRLDNWTTGLAALTIYNAAYMAEILRGAWVAQPREPIEAGIAFGFSEIRLFRRIILPPLLLSAGPVIGNQMIQIIKDSAFLTIIALPELTHAASSIQSRHYVPFAAFITAVFLYWGLCLVIEAGVSSIGRVADAPSLGQAMAASSKVLDVAGVSKQFGGVEVLSDVSFTVDKGETVCVLGPSGSGKSTLLRCINWLEQPDAGQIYLNGSRVGINSAGTVMSDRHLSEIRTRIGMVFQHFALWPHLTVLQNLMEAPVQVQRRPKAEVRDEALALLAKVGLSEKRDAFPAKLSGGQKQRVGIARALAIRPDLLLFDEPTSALDPELVGEVLVVMRELAREGMTMVIVTHEMGLAREAATRVLFMDRGRAVETGSPEQFFSNPETERAQQFLQRYAGDTAARR